MLNLLRMFWVNVADEFADLCVLFLSECHVFDDLG